MLDDLKSLSLDTWPRVALFSLAAAVVIAVPSDLIDTPFFGRPVDATRIDYAILAITSFLIGLILAIRPDPDAAEAFSQSKDGDDRRTIWSGFVAFLAVGCPVCNQVVVVLLGTSGALAWWAPVQPLVGLLAVSLLVYTLRRRLKTFRLTSCPVPSPR